jgi:hypothetical protein
MAPGRLSVGSTSGAALWVWLLLCSLACVHSLACRGRVSLLVVLLECCCFVSFVGLVENGRPALPADAVIVDFTLQNPNLLNRPWA